MAILAQVSHAGTPRERPQGLYVQTITVFVVGIFACGPPSLSAWSPTALMVCGALVASLTPTLATLYIDPKNSGRLQLFCVLLLGSVGACYGVIWTSMAQEPILWLIRY